ncbi:glycosyltransferase family 4 protein [uncultured Roseobacter sp.]|uniref:glycosyltransferase family 4 protein n=1 Tax=uncultured Roseobacter sp. TaxID=114847 RepID=UPI00263004B2|nr:glycosyltransferase family 4 protein [uncultured Roseobacter sp.]
MDGVPVVRMRATFAVPGDLNALTGGYIYEKQVLMGLRRAGWEVDHLALPGSFPDPTEADLSVTEAALAALPPDDPVLLDGFLPGSMPPERLRALRAPFVAITHHPLGYETGLPPARAAHLVAVERANLARAAHVVVPSPHTAAVLTSDFDIAAERITIARPGIHPPVARQGPPADPPEILCVGQLVPRKGQDVLLAALAQLVDLPWHARLVGGTADTAYAERLRAQVGALGLGARVSFTGAVPPEALAAHYAQASLFALPTHYEGYGMVFAEALSYGLPIVTCRAGAVPDTVPEDAGHLVPPGDADAFAAALRAVLSDAGHAAALAKAAARHGRAQPLWDDTAATVAAVLSRL